MKKSLLMTTALVAAFSATNVCAEDWTISSKETITDELISRDNVTVATGGDITISGNNSGIISNGNFTMEDGSLTASSNGGSADTGVFVRGENSSVTIKNGTINLTEARIAKGEEDTDTTGDVNISGGKITLNNQAYIEMYDTNTGSVNLSGGELNINDNSGILLDGANNFTMTGGTLTATSNGNSADTGVFVKGDGADVNIQGGDINLTDSRIYKGNDTATSGDINISGGNITLNKNAYIEMRKENTGNVNMTGGKLVMNENLGLLLNTNDNQEIDGNAIKFIVNGDDATIIANGNNQISGDIDFTKGTITVANGASLTSGDIAMKSENAKIDLSGKLDTNVSGSGNLCFKNSAANISGNVTGSNLTFEADHSLSKAIGGTIGNITALNVSKGTLTYDKDTGSIGNVSVAGGAGLDIGTNKLTATTVDFADNSTLGLKVASADNYGQINANTINIGNDTTMKVTLDSGVVANGETKDFNFLQGNVTGDFTNKIADNNRYDISFEDGSFKITGTASASDVVADAGGSATNAATAEAWDTLTSSSTASPKAKAVASVLSDLSQSNEQAYVAALTAVAPEVAPMVQKTQTETANQVFGAVSTRLTGGSISTGGEGMSSGDNIFKRGAMGSGMFNKSKLDDTSKAKGFDADSSGIAFGAEKFVTDDTKVGIGYAYTNTDIDGFMRSTDVDTHTAIVYGEYKPSNWYVNGIATYGWSDYEENKSVAGVGVKADYDVETFGLQAMTGYDMQVNGFGLTPEVGMRYVHISQDSYKDSADQRVSGNDSDILTGVIGAKVSKNFELSNGMNIKPEVRIAATYDLMNDDVNSVVTLANGSAYAVDGEALDRFGMEFGAGVTAEVNDNVELSLGYEGKFREDYQDHTGLINAKYKF
ncbi:MAG: autotransporter domain-containing protein [Alphaproteobacteria bacterium]